MFSPDLHSIRHAFDMYMNDFIFAHVYLYSWYVFQGFYVALVDVVWFGEFLVGVRALHIHNHVFIFLGLQL